MDVCGDAVGLVPWCVAAAVPGKKWQSDRTARSSNVVSCWLVGPHYRRYPAACSLQ